jgi:hypothetical protein
MIEPKPVSGISPQAAWLRGMLNFLRSQVLQPGPGYRIKQLPGGVVLELQQQGGPGKGPAPSNIALYVVAGTQNPPGSGTIRAYLQDNFVWAIPAAGGQRVKVLLPTKLRPSNLTAVIDDVRVNYTLYNAWDQTRVATTVPAFPGDTARTEKQVIVPRYLSGDRIFVLTDKNLAASIAGESDVDGIDINVDGRAWSRSYAQ